MKTDLTGNFFSSSLIRSMCCVLFITASGCASTSIPIIPSEATDTPDIPDTSAIVPIKEGERDLYVIVSKGDHVLVYTKDGRKLGIVLTEVDLQKQTIIGTGTVFYKHNNSWGSSPAHEFGIDVNFSEIESIEIKDPEDYRPIPIGDVHVQPIRFPSTVGRADIWTWENFGIAFAVAFCPLCF